VTNEFLQLFDSLSLYNFLVDHSNPKTMLAVEDLARFFEGAKVGRVVSPAARSAEQASPRVVSRPSSRQSEPEEHDPGEEPASGQRDQGEPSADDLRGPEPEENPEPEARTDNPGGPENEQEAAAAPVEDREDGQFDFDDSADRDAVTLSVPSPGQTSKAQEEELRSVRDQAIVLPSGTAASPQAKGKRGGDKPMGGQKRKLKFKTETENGATN
jgi:hypothetical protein